MAILNNGQSGSDEDNLPTSYSDTSGYQTTPPDQSDDEDESAGPEDATSLAATVQKHATSTRPPLPTDSKALVDQMNQLAAKYDNAPEESKKTLADAMNKADQLYKTQANRNDWLEVAQMLGRAGAQFAGALSGRNGGNRTDMAGLDFGPGIDYARKTEQAAKDRNESVAAARGQNENDLANQKADYERNITPLEYGFKGAEGESQRQNSLAEAQKREDAANTRTAQSETNANIRAGASEANANKRAGIASNTEITKASMQDKSLQAAADKQKQGQQYQTIRDEMKETRKEMQDAQAAIPALAGEISGDESDKDMASFRNKHARELGTLSPKQISDAKKGATTPGKLWGTNFDQDKFQQNLSDQVQQTYGQKLTNLRQALDQIGQTPSSPLRTTTPSQQQTSKTLSGDDLQKYATKHNITPDAAATFLKSQGYSIGK